MSRAADANNVSATNDVDAGEVPPPPNGALAEALRNEGLDEYVAAFYQRGYRELRDLGETDGAAAKAVAEVVPENRPGDRNRILRLWKDAVAKKEAPRPVAAPKLPAGTKLDVTLEKPLPDVPSFKIPTTIGTPGSPRAVRNAADLSSVEWLTIARNNRLTYGIDLERMLTLRNRGEFESDHAALVWKVPENLDFLVTDDASYSSTEICYSHRLEQLSHARIAQASLEVSTPFVGAAADASREEREAQTQERKTLRMSGRWNYPRAKLRLRYCTDVSPDFVRAVESALEAKDNSARFERLSRVFHLYGHVVPEEIVLGGQMYFDMQRDMRGDVDAHSIRNTVDAAVSVKFPSGSSGGASASFDDGTGTKVTAQSINELASWRAIGGDTTLSDDPGKWRDTVKDCNLWKVIERKGLVPVTNWLDSELRARVLEVWNLGLKRLWAGHPAPKGYVYPQFKGRPFTISSGLGGMASVVSGSSDVILRYSDGYGPYGFPLTVTDGMLKPEEAGCYWQLVYAGTTTAQGTPVYWIVKYEQDTAEEVMQLMPPSRSQPVLKRAADHQLGCRYTDEVFTPPIPQPGQNNSTDANFWVIGEAPPIGEHRYFVVNLASANLLVPREKGQRPSFTLGPHAYCVTSADRQIGGGGATSPSGPPRDAEETTALR